MLCSTLRFLFKNLSLVLALLSYSSKLVLFIFFIFYLIFYFI